MLSGLAVLAFAAAATAAEPLPQGYTPADWLKKPTAEEMMAVWPSKALKTGQGGKATISCKVTVQGALTLCRVLSESPTGAGFGGAALALTAQFAMKPATQDGKPVEGEARIPINFAAFTPASGPMITNTVLPGVLMHAAPTYAEVAAAFPAKARAKGVGGRAAMSCVIGKTGGLTGCSVISETPNGLGFGAAAKSLAPKFAAPLSVRGDESTRGDLAQITVSFPAEMLDPAAGAIIGKPYWVSTPNGEQLSAAMPKDRQTGSMRVVLDCLIAPDGSATDCKVASETPPGQGYGESTLKVAPFFKMSVWTMEGLPTVGARVKIPIRYEIAEKLPAKP